MASDDFDPDNENEFNEFNRSDTHRKHDDYSAGPATTPLSLDEVKAAFEKRLLPLRNFVIWSTSSGHEKRKAHQYVIDASGAITFYVTRVITAGGQCAAVNEARLSLAPGTWVKVWEEVA